MKIATVTNRPMDENTYICYNEKSLEAVIIDPGFETDKILAKIESLNLRVTDILLTHGHFDHIYNTDVLKKKTGAKVWAHISEKSVLISPDANGSVRHCETPFTVFPDNWFVESDYTFGGVKLKVIHTPGHTQGSTCFFSELQNTLFTGDTLFESGIGRSDLATGNHAALLNSIRQKIFTLPDNTTVLPGHGGKTTVSFERDNNPEME